ncbi:nucleotidyltransferase domain-containing protein [Gottfriedia sp. NPDC058432]|uniref:nucleotidyltransferase domain-containing protein n=1 Tax=Gottfriedia sp. NPDC058432 TaxID=3346497 RepID=UPI00365CFE01
MDNSNKVEKQLKILSDINTICLNLKFHIWLRGGWAIDFLLGKVTREHSDIDLVSLIQYRDELEQAMVKAGFKKNPVSMLQTDFIKDEIDVSFVFVKISEEGKIIANGFPDWEWRNDALPIQKYNLKGISINVLNPYQLLEEKKVYEKGTGRKLRPKDIESMKVIQGIIDAIS